MELSVLFSSVCGFVSQYPVCCFCETGYKGSFTELLPSHPSKQCFNVPGFMQWFDFCALTFPLQLKG